MKNKIFILCLSLLACRDTVFDHLGKNKATPNNTSPNIYFAPSGEIIRCNNDLQCGLGNVCYKETESVGVCVKTNP